MGCCRRSGGHVQRRTHRRLVSLCASGTDGRRHYYNWRRKWDIPCVDNTPPSKTIPAPNFAGQGVSTHWRFVSIDNSTDSPPMHKTTMAVVDEQSQGI